MSATADRQAPRPVMADVARRADFSHKTVSRVLNGHPNVSPETRADVLAAIRELGYRPNVAARTLVTRANVLGVISFDTTLYSPGLDALRNRARGTSRVFRRDPQPAYLGHQTVHHRRAR